MYNTFGSSFKNNTIKQLFRNNNINANFNANGGVNFMSATHVYQGYPTDLLTNSSGTPILRYYDDTNDQQIVAANA